MKNLRLVEYAVALDRHRSFARAAQEMRVTQPTFSRGIAALEADLGTRLFDRSTRRVEPTPQGVFYLQRAAALVADAFRLRQALDEYQSLQSGHLTIGVGPYPLDISVTEAVSRIASRHPGLHIRLLEGEWRDFGGRLLAREVEVAVMEASIVSVDPRFEVAMLPSHAGCFFCRSGHPLATRTGLTMREILGYPFVGTAMGGRPMQQFVKGLPGILTDPATGDILPRVTVTSVEAMRQIVKRTDGIGVTLPSQIEEGVRNGSLAMLDVGFEPIRTGYGAAWLKDRTLSPAARLFVSTIKEVEVELALAPSPLMPRRPSKGRLAGRRTG